MTSLEHNSYEEIELDTGSRHEEVNESDEEVNESDEEANESEESDKKAIIAPGWYSFLKTNILVIVLGGYIALGTVVFGGFESQNQKIRNYMYLEKQAVFNKTYGNRSSFGEFYTKRLKIYEAQCRIEKLELQSWNNKSFMDSYEYSYSIISTCGWGFFYPKSTTLKIITLIYAFIGIPLLAALVGAVVLAMQELANTLVKKWSRFRHCCGNRVVFMKMFITFFILFVCLDTFFIKWWLNSTLDTVGLDITGQKSEFTYVNALYWYLISRLLAVGFGERTYVWGDNLNLMFIFITFFTLFIFIGYIAVVQSVFGEVKAWIGQSIDKSMGKHFKRKNEVI